jgi:4-amino-4-deoxy-L-arabinose transferase-like glycosyltransferase
MNPFKNKFFLIIFFIALLLRVQMMWSFDIDHDEWYTLDVASRPFIEMHQYIIDDVHLPLYYYASKIVFMLFGVSEFSLRIPAVLFGLAGIVVFFMFLWKFFGKAPAYLGTSLLAVSGFHVAYSLTARMYSLLFLLTVISMYFLYSYIQKPTNKNFWYLVICNILLFYTHLFAVFFFLFELIVLYRKSIKETFKLILYTGIGSIPVFLFYLYQVYKKIVGMSHANWMSPTHYSEIYWVFSAMSSSYVLTTAFIALFALFIFVFWKKISVFGKEQFLVLQVLICISIPMFITLFIEPIFALRYFMVAYPAFLICIILMLDHIRKINRIVFIVLIAAIFFFTIFAVGIFHVDKVLVQDYTKGCYSYIADELHAHENITIFVPRWLNDWHPHNHPTTHAFDFFRKRFDIPMTLVNYHHTQPEVNTKLVAILSPTLYHPYINDSNWTYIYDHYCRGLHYKLFNASS